MAEYVAQGWLPGPPPELLGIWVSQQGVLPGQDMGGAACWSQLSAICGCRAQQVTWMPSRQTVSCGALDTLISLDKASGLQTQPDAAHADMGLDSAAGTFWTQSMQVSSYRACAGKISMRTAVHSH